MSGAATVLAEILAAVAIVAVAGVWFLAVKLEGRRSRGVPSEPASPRGPPAS